jgi:hypothetical protein
MLFASIGLSRADVTYSYVAGNQDGTVGSADGTASWTGVAGTVVNIPVYLHEEVTQTNTVGNAQTSIINMAFYKPPIAPSTNSALQFNGVGSIGMSFVATGVSAGGTASQIGSASEVVWTPAGAANGQSIPGIANTTGFSFGPQFGGTFDNSAQNGNDSQPGGSDLATIYQNVNNPSGLNGNNLQVTTTLESSAQNGQTNTINKGAITKDSLTLPNTSTALAGTSYIGSGNVLIGTVNVTIGQGQTTFKVGGLSNSKLVAPTDANFNPSFEGVPLTSYGIAAGTYSGATTPVSQTNTNTILGMNILSDTVRGAVLLDVTYNASSNQHQTTNAYNTWLSASIHGNGGTGTIPGGSPIAGPSATPATNSFIPYFTSDSTPFTVTVGTATVPEPSSMALCGLLTMGGAWFASKRRRKIAA